MEPKTRSVLCCLLAVACSTSETPSGQPSNGWLRVARAAPAAPLPAALDGVSDSAITRLAASDVTRVEKGKGGRSLAFVVTLADGSVGYFKPDQRFAANWYAEVASYHLDRELGLQRVPPAVGRRLPWALLEKAAGSDARVAELRIRADGSMRGALTAWIPPPLEPLAASPGWQRWLSSAEPPAITPFQRPEAYRRAKLAGRASPVPPPAPEPDRPDRPAELSDLVLFDHLTANLDRWGGGFTNVQTRGPGGPLVFLDNANGFPAQTGKSPLLEARLRSVERFRRTTIEAIRRLDIERFRARLDRDPLAPLLSAEQLRALEKRRGRLLAHVAEIERVHGAAAFPW